MKRRALAVILVVGCLGQGACVDTYSDTRLQLNLWTGTGVDRRFLTLPTPGKRPGDEGYYSHYELHARLGARGLVRLTSFVIQPALRTDNPCLQFLPDTLCVDAEYACDPYINLARYQYLESIYAVISPDETRAVDDPGNPYGFDHVPGYDYQSWPWHLFVDAGLTDPASKLARENLVPREVEDFCNWCLPAGYYVPNPKLLTMPVHGELYGVVDGPDPRTGAQVGGVTLWVPGKLRDLTELLVVRERDPGRLSPQNLLRTDLLPGADSQVFLVARRDESVGYIREGEYRGVVTVFLENPYTLPIYLHGTIFVDMDEDPVGI